MSDRWTTKKAKGVFRRKLKEVQQCWPRVLTTFVPENWRSLYRQQGSKGADFLSNSHLNLLLASLDPFLLRWSEYIWKETRLPAYPKNHCCKILSLSQKATFLSNFDRENLSQSLSFRTQDTLPRNFSSGRLSWGALKIWAEKGVSFARDYLVDLVALNSQPRDEPFQNHLQFCQFSAIIPTTSLCTLPVSDNTPPFRWSSVATLSLRKLTTFLSSKWPIPNYFGFVSEFVHQKLDCQNSPSRIKPQK